MRRVTVKKIDDRHFQVEIADGSASTTHDVEIPAGFLDDLAVDDRRVISETFAFLLEREPASSIMRHFSLDVVTRFFPEYPDELRRRLG